MKLDDLMIRAYMEGFSGASIYCETGNRDEVMTFISDGCDRIGEFIHTVDEAEYGVRVYLPMENAFGVEEFDSKSILKSFEELLSELKAKMPSIKYRAYFACRFDDATNDIVNCDICNNEVFSDEEMRSNDEPYDFVGFALKFATVVGGTMWGNLLEILEANDAGLEEIESIANCIKVYVKAGLLDDAAYGEMLSMVSDYDDDMCIPLAESLL